MKKFYTMENFLKSGYYNIPRLILDSERSSCEKTVLRARILRYFYEKVYFAKGEVMFNGRRYVCFRGEFIARQVELAEYFNLDRKQWNRIMTDFQSESILKIERVRGGSRFTIVAYDCIVGKKSAQYKQANGGDKAAEEAAPKAKKAKLGVSVENYYPEHHVKGCYIPKLEIDLSKIPEFQEKNTDK
ncbi:MAG: hypothetical protein LIR40_09245 [Bacteroidota bacterium]|nr:hypothetical protein [Bacteroidota bacterium]